ncbi:MAG: hypothetical protein ACXVJB_06195 [Mucilaginibacter sp.]
MSELTTEEVYQVRGIKLQAKAVLILQAIGFLSAIYLATDPFDFVFDETKWLLMFIAVLAYLLFFIVIMLRLAFKRELQINSSKKLLIIIWIFDGIPSILLLLLALNDIF